MLFCDTSALVKLYVRETGSDELKALAQAAGTIAVCRIAWAEARAALARRVRIVPADADAIRLARRALAQDWPNYLIIDVTQPLAELAADHADTFALRAYDSVQLAAAHRLAGETGEQTAFACFDARLNKAAGVLGLQTPFAETA